MQGLTTYLAEYILQYCELKDILILNQCCSVFHKCPTTRYYLDLLTNCHDLDVVYHGLSTDDWRLIYYCHPDSSKQNSIYDMDEYRKKRRKLY